MVMSITNARAVQPFVRTIETTTDVLNFSLPRGHQEQTLQVDNALDVTLTIPVINRFWIEIYLDGFRLINYTRDFGNTYLTYNLIGNQIIFSQPVTGSLRIIADNPSFDDLAGGLVIPVNNVQGARTRATQPGQNYLALHCEPIILTQPVFGYARLTSDRMSIVYVPPLGFNGGDAFSYTVISDRAQIAEPKCIFIQVGTVIPSEPMTPP